MPDASSRPIPYSTLIVGWHPEHVATAGGFVAALNAEYRVLTLNPALPAARHPVVREQLREVFAKAARVVASFGTEVRTRPWYSRLVYALDKLVEIARIPGEAGPSFHDACASVRDVLADAEREHFARVRARLATMAAGHGFGTARDPSRANVGSRQRAPHDTRLPAPARREVALPRIQVPAQWDTVTPDAGPWWTPLAVAGGLLGAVALAVLAVVHADRVAGSAARWGHGDVGHGDVEWDPDVYADEHGARYEFETVAALDGHTDDA